MKGGYDMKSKILTVRNIIIYGISHRLCIVLRTFFFVSRYGKLHIAGECRGTRCECNLQLYDQLPVVFKYNISGFLYDICGNL